MEVLFMLFTIAAGGLMFAAFYFHMVAETMGDKVFYALFVGALVAMVSGGFITNLYQNERYEKELEVESKVCPDKVWLHPKYMEGFFTVGSTLYRYHLDNPYVKSTVSDDKCYFIRSHASNHHIQSDYTVSQRYVQHLRKAE
jgi:hypothetical protein